MHLIWKTDLKRNPSRHIVYLFDGDIEIKAEGAEAIRCFTYDIVNDCHIDVPAQRHLGIVSDLHGVSRCTVKPADVDQKLTTCESWLLFSVPMKIFFTGNLLLYPQNNFRKTFKTKRYCAHKFSTLTTCVSWPVPWSGQYTRVSQ